MLNERNVIKQLAYPAEKPKYGFILKLMKLVN